MTSVNVHIESPANALVRQFAAQARHKQLGGLPMTVPDHPADVNRFRYRD
jgi:hypothetical protein